MLSREDIERIARLANVTLDESDIEKYRKDVSAIVDFIGQISSLPSLEHAEHQQIMKLENVWREDEEREITDETSVTEHAPRTKNGFVVTPRTIKGDDA
jgi:aspartyl-tRNA(Asn)/glutamyl-tRNA(Gln) amidotransferase subunit C